MNEIYDMCASDIQTHRVQFILNPSDIWQTYNIKLKSITDNGNWSEIKFLSNDNNTLHSDFRKIPKNMGGIYVFVLKGGIIPNSHVYIMYVGRALLTDTQNLNKRLHRYLHDDRPKIRALRETWGKYLYIKYLPLDDNDLIKDLESELIKVIIPPFNEQYPDVISNAVRSAF